MVGLAVRTHLTAKARNELELKWIVHVKGLTSMCHVLISAVSRRTQWTQVAVVCALFIPKQTK